MAIIDVCILSAQRIDFKPESGDRIQMTKVNLYELERDDSDEENFIGFPVKQMTGTLEIFKELDRYCNDLPMKVRIEVRSKQNLKTGASKETITKILGKIKSSDNTGPGTGTTSGTTASLNAALGKV